MKTKIVFILFIVSLFFISWTIESDDNKSTDDVCFERDVLPIFLNSCALSGCHNSESRQEGFVFDSYESIRTSKKGRAIIPHNLKRSKVYKKITEDTNEDRMPPPPHPPLSGAEISMISKWIMSGALDSKCFEDGKINEDIGKSNDSINIPQNIDINCDTLNLTYKDIQPIIEKNCYKCHSGNAPGELFNLDTYQQVKEKGESEKLYGVINHLPGFKKMPLKSPKLQGCELSKINSWISSGMSE